MRHVWCCAACSLLGSVDSTCGGLMAWRQRAAGGRPAQTKKKRAPTICRRAAQIDERPRMFSKLSPRGRPAAPSASWERQVRTKNAVMRARSSKQVIAMPDESRSPNKKPQSPGGGASAAPPSTVAHELQTLHEALSELRAHLDGTAAAAATAAATTAPQPQPRLWPRRTPLLKKLASRVPHLKKIGLF